MMKKFSKFSIFETINSNNFFVYNFVSDTLNIFKSKNNINLNSVKKYILENEDVFIKNNILIDESIDENIIMQGNYFNKLRKENNVLYITIVMTKKCNFNCIYCDQNHDGENISKDTIDSILKFIKNNINKHESLYLNFFGGEPLLQYEQIIYILQKSRELCKKSKKQMFALTSTNGYLLSKEKFLNLLKLGLRSYQITIDGIEEAHDRNRFLKSGKGSYSKILTNLIEIKNSVKSNIFDITIRNNLTKSALKNYSIFLDEMHKYFKNDSRFLFFPSRLFENSDWKIKEQYNDETVLGDELILAKKMLKERNLQIYNHFNKLIELPVGCKSISLSDYTIMTNGDVLVCPHWDADDGSLTYGKLNLNGDIEITNEYLYAKITALHRKEKCDKCPFDYVCFSGKYCLIPEQPEQQCDYIISEYVNSLRILAEEGKGIIYEL